MAAAQARERLVVPGLDQANPRIAQRLPSTDCSEVDAIRHVVSAGW
jgi:hypothetical protein